MILQQQKYLVLLLLPYNNNQNFKEEFILSRQRLLYLNNGTTLTSANKLDERFESFGLRVEKFWAFNNEFPSNLFDYDGIFISGSPHGAYEDISFINEEHELIIVPKEGHGFRKPENRLMLYKKMLEHFDSTL